MAGTSSAVLTTTTQDEPAERRMFQLTDLETNHNKFYMVEIWPVQGDTVRFRALWGRVGSKAQVQEKVVPRHEVERQIREKLRKGYRKVDLHTPVIERIEDPEDAQANGKPAVRVDPRVAELVEWIFTEAGEHIQSFLAVEVEALSQAQMAEGRRLLSEAHKQFSRYQVNPLRKAANLKAFAETVQAYYNTIPTKLPARLDRGEVVEQFAKSFSEQEDRLLQLEAAIATMKVQRRNPGSSHYESLGAEIAPLPPDDPAHKTVSDYLSRTLVHGYKVRLRDVFEVRIPEERQAYEEHTSEATRRELFFHGSRNQNVRHILRQGLICPSTPSNGRMLGNGIYLANMASKSINYCQAGRRGVPRMLLVVEAALGNTYVAPQAAAFNAPPVGYDSVCGKAGHTRTWGTSTLAYDEFVVYSRAQQTIRYLVTIE